jgi:hypothetical protein
MAGQQCFDRRKQNVREAFGRVERDFFDEATLVQQGDAADLARRVNRQKPHAH